MRKLAIAVALSSTMLATPALARDGAWYVGGDFGPMIVEDIDVDIGAVEDAVSIDHEYGFDGDLFVGYDFGAFRLEAEVAYKKADLDEVENTIRLPGQGPTGFAGIREAGGSTDALSFMLNGMLDFGDDEGVSGFVGGGVGVARVEFNNARIFSNQAPFLDDSDTRFAWQVIAGVRQAISDNVDVQLKYRFFNVDDINVQAFNGGETDARFRSHSLLGGFIFNFGAPPPVTPGPFIVFFDWDRSDITPQAAAILDNAAAAYQQTGSAQVVLAGHADRSGSAQYNVGLSQRRADAVRQYLAGRGVNDGAMTTEAFGESRPLVETADGVREPQNRRVEITFGPGSGM
jgi:OmpA-OmpF porin, OOP family